MVVGTELKIFNSVRIQMKLEEQERLLLQARMAALQNQINPHFLFNTLNSISSLVRFDPDTAREMILKLATILRRLLNSTDSFVPLREEVEFIDNYLDIEVVRFGRDKLKVVKDLDPASLEAMVPSMLLQPLVENCIKHGLAPKVEGGSITLRSRADRIAARGRSGRRRRGHGGGAICSSSPMAWRHRHRHGQRRRAPEGALRRRRQNDDRKPRRRRHAGPLAAADSA